ncbi:MAG: FGGY family carbohydrate kinase [Actinomycetota bacterium]
MADDPVALGIDIGTGSTKVGLVTADGDLVAVGRSEHPIEEPHPGWSETDPARWLISTWTAAADALAAGRDSGMTPRVMAIGLSGQMHGVVLADDRGRALRPAILWSDRRSEPILDQLRADLDSAFGGDAGSRLANPVVAGMAGPTVAALDRAGSDNGPSALPAGTAMMLQPKDWVRFQLTGVLATDPSDASATLLWDVAADRWSAEAAAVFGVNPSWLPPVLPSASVGGLLLAESATKLGLQAGLPVAVGAADTAAALLGAGIGPGETQVSIGTGGQIAQPVAEPRIDRSGRTHLFRAATLRPDDPSQWYAMAAMQNVGIVNAWARSIFAVGDQELETIMTSAGRAEQAEETGSTGRSVRFQPYLTGERTPHIDATLTGGVTGLRTSTTREELIRAVYRGVADAIGDGRRALTEAGVEVTEALLAGGGSLAPWWRQLLADALGVTLVPHNVADASVRGAGLLGWAGLGRVIDPRAGVATDTTIHRPRPHQPVH